MQRLKGKEVYKDTQSIKSTKGNRESWKNQDTYGDLINNRGSWMEGGRSEEGRERKSCL